jgi:hypothetical protein
MVLTQLTRLQKNKALLSIQLSPDPAAANSISKIYDVVLFHYPCQDGLASGWITNHYHKLRNKSIELYPIQHGSR